MNKKLIETWIAKNDPQGATKLAASCEVSPATIARILNGHVTSFPVAKKIAEVMKVSLDELGKDDSDPAA